ncbi:MAG TPA: threonine-phosphate decarboxylase CobD [Alphaproteobacteria bacterium]|nr:threonine-phosphate decarboxylase CobD [Alphaproteobacteria bacterium]
MSDKERSISPSGTPPLPAHGGDLARVAEARGAFAGAWLDLSTGINPWPYPVESLPTSLWARLPGERLDERLRQAAQRYYGAPDADCVAPAPGSQALIQWLPRLRAAARVAVLGPTYSEHAAQWSAAGHRVETWGELAALVESGPDVAVVANPNNPDGRRLAPASLLALAHRLAARGGWLVVDEAFADVTPELSLAREVMRPGLILLRSFGKFFGLAGLRLGFALAAPPLAKRLREALGPWAVSGPALWIASVAFADESWARLSRARLAQAALQLEAVLAAAGLAVLGGTDLYRLAASPRAAEIYATLLRHGIYARRFAEEPTWLRFGLPPDAHALRRLAEALGAAEPTPLLPAEAAHE